MKCVKQANGTILCLKDKIAAVFVETEGMEYCPRHEYKHQQDPKHVCHDKECGCEKPM